jgi:hypothetical protein
MNTKGLENERASRITGTAQEVSDRLRKENEKRLASSEVIDLIKGRLGRFWLTGSFLARVDLSTLLPKIFADVVVVDSSYLPICDAIEYCAMSKHFRVSEGEVVIPSYNVEISSDGVRFVEVKGVEHGSI